MYPKKSKSGLRPGYAQGSIKITAWSKDQRSILKATASKTKTPDEVKLLETTDRFPPKVNYVDVV